MTMESLLTPVVSKAKAAKEAVTELLLVPMVDCLEAAVHLPLKLQISEVEMQFPNCLVEGL